MHLYVHLKVSCISFLFFSENSGYFFPVLKKTPEKYYQPCSEGVKQWLMDLKADKKCVFLTTSSHIDFASVTAKAVLGFVESLLSIDMLWQCDRLNIKERQQNRLSSIE